MSYEAPITIKKAIDNIRKKQFVLPSIQREFVWDTDQIEKLFDSLMRDYPISTFLFWKVDKKKIKDYQFYEFLKKYHERTARHNTKADLADDQDIIAFLDGQQRMTSMYIGLSGTFASKLPYHRWDNPKAFPEERLYLNLLQTSDDIEFEYDFRFLTDKEVVSDDDNYWFLCNDILELTDMSKTSMYLMKHKLMDTSVYTEAQSEFAINTLNEFFNVIHQKKTISYFLEEGEELDKVLQIFIRINSGGTKLSYSDLLLSIATAQWEEKDAREVIHEFVDEINAIGDGFAFNKDFVLKACLVLADITDIKFKVDNFNKSNMQLIEKQWDVISDSIRAGIQLVSKLGYNRDTFMASNAMIPIAYFIKVNNFATSILQDEKRADDRDSIMEWLARVFLKGTFGGTPDALYPALRTVTNNNLGKFPLEEIIDYYKGKSKSIAFTEDDVENILELEYSKSRTFAALSILYSSLNFNYKYHQDHIHPKSFFKRRGLRKRGLDDDVIEEFMYRFNKLPNIQLLESTQNIQKSDRPFNEWLEDNYGDQNSRESYLNQNHISKDLSLDLDDFIVFYETRKTKLKEKLAKLFKVTLNTQGDN